MKAHASFTPFQLWLYHFARLVGLAPFEVRNNNLRPVGSLCKVHALVLVLLCALWASIICVYRQPRVVEVSSVNQFVFVMHMVLFTLNVGSTLLIFAFNSDGMVEIIEQLIAIQEELKTLGIEDDGGKKRAHCYARIMATNFVVLSIKVIIASAFNLKRRNDGVGFKAVDSIGSTILVVYSHNAVLIFTETMICIRQRFESLNNKLQGIVGANCDLVSPREHRAVPEVSAASGCIGSSLEDVAKVEELHSKLHDLAQSATHFHTIPILLTLVHHSSALLTKCYATYTYVLSSQYIFKNTHNVVLVVQHVVIELVINIMDLFLIAHACTTVCRVGNATKAVLHEVWNKFHPEDLRSKFFMFSLQLLHKPVTVAAFGFFHLDYSYIYKIFCAMVAYFVIMIQLDSSQPNLGT